MQRLYRLMPPYGRFSVEEFKWDMPVEGLMVHLPMSHLDYVELVVDGTILMEGKHYERVIEGNQRGILWLPEYMAAPDGWAILKVYKRPTKEDKNAAAQ